jgi:cytochrome oxidase assembly protein ShyY1
MDEARAAYTEPAPDITTVTTGGPEGSRAQARGTFDGSHETVLRNRLRGGIAGVDVLTPLKLSDGTAVLVDRGWVRAASASGLSTDPPAQGVALVHGLVHDSSPLSANDTVEKLDDGRLAVPRVDLDAIGRTMPYDLRPVWIEAQAIDPAPTGKAPELPQPPPVDPVNHMQYALQWFAFALIPLIGWPIALRRLAHRRNAETSGS